MYKTIWVICDNREEIINAQRCINSIGSMKATCILSRASLLRCLDNIQTLPSVIVFDYEMTVREAFDPVLLVKGKEALKGIPLFYMAENPKEVESEEVVAVISKPMTAADVGRMEKLMWQFEVVKYAEKTLEKQTMDIIAAREIKRLNEQLRARNALLYRVFGRYFSDEVMTKIIDDPNGAIIGGDKVDMTVMLTDLRGFTAMSSTMDSDSLLKLLNHYFSRMVEIINSYSGTIIEFLGDGILAVFGSPIITDNHAELAVTAALTMQNRMRQVNEYCELNGYSHLSMGIGIHSGSAFIGNIGSEKVMRYNVIGRVVNECSRIESYSVGEQVLVSEDTLKRIQCGYNKGEKYEVKAKGVNTPITAYEIMGISGQYNINLTSNRDYNICVPKKDIHMELYAIRDKKISDDGVKCVVKGMSDKRIIFDCENTTDISNHADYKALGLDADGTIMFLDVYGKTHIREDGSMHLLLTYIDGSYTAMMDTIKKGEM